MFCNAFLANDYPSRRLTLCENSFIIFNSRRGGEIGIRTRLKIWREQSHVGSTPTLGISIFLFRLQHLPTSFLSERS